MQTQHEADRTTSIMMSRALLILELGKRIGRQRAHDAVYETAQASVTRARSLRGTPAENPHVSAGPTPSQIGALLDPTRYARLCREFAERGAPQAREVAAALLSGGHEATGPLDVA